MNAAPVKDTRTLLKETYLELQRMRQELDAFTEPIAVIGMGCRFPGGADSPAAFWQLLHDGVDAVGDIPPDRWDVDAYYDPNPDAPGKIATRSGGFLRQIDQFDPLFFGISPREAVSMDPQQRLLLEVTWEALEHAGQAPERLTDSRTGMFVGIGQNDYARWRLNSGDPTAITAYDGTGNGLCFASGRLSYVFGLMGPNMAIDTACSSSLVATHLAYHSLRLHECDLALVGGVQLILAPEVFIFLSRAHVLAPDGRCKTFSAAADGFGRGEGCGVLVLKRLSDAIANRDQVFAVLRGSAVNHIGTSGGLTVPNVKSQQALLRDALKNARIEPGQVGYIEAHGTGTALGDPIEIRALETVLGDSHSKKSPLMLGSVKTNIGHLEAAAGIAGLMKVILALHHQEIPPHLHFKEPNPRINWESLPFAVPTTPTPWKTSETPRIAGVSSFGIAGTNAHIILAEAPPDTYSKNGQQEVAERPVHLLTLSAKTENALRELTQRYVNYCAADSALTIGDVCFTANAGRSHFAHRHGFLAASTQELREKLSEILAGQTPPGFVSGQAQQPNPPKIGFLFTGQGSQYVGMGRELYETQPSFRQTLERCDQFLRPFLEIPLLDVLYPDEQQSQISHLTSQIDLTAYTQPALFAIETALSQLLLSWGITPTAVLGHSIGEYAAACAAGVFSLEDGLKLVAERGRLMQSLPREGSMVAVLADEKSVSEVIRPYSDVVAIAAINGPQNVVISGQTETIAAITTKFKEQGVKTTALNVSHAFHSPLMEPILWPFEQTASTITYAAPRIPIVCDSTGTLATTELSFAVYWRQHIRQPVRFAAGMDTLRQYDCDLFVEIGPQPILLGMGRQCLPAGNITWLPTLRQKHSDWEQLLHALAELYIHGVAVDWEGVDRDYPRQRISLPTYPFQRARYWVDPVSPPSSKPAVAVTTPAEAVKRPYIFGLSATSREALQHAARQQVEAITRQPEQSLAEICRRAYHEPKHLPFRLATVAESPQQLQTALRQFAGGQETPGIVTGQVDPHTAPSVVFLFSALGSHYPGMGMDLYKAHPVFRRAFDECAAAARVHFQHPLLDIINAPDLEQRPIAEITASLFALEYALVAVWKSWGITPGIVFGSSLGEVPAATVAGVVNIPDGLKLVILIPRLFQPYSQHGVVAAVLADEAVVQQALKPYAPDVSIIVYAGPQNLIAGRPQAIQAITADFEARGIEVKRMDAVSGLHSPQVEPILQECAQITQALTYRLPNIPIISCVSGEPINAEIATPEHWCNHIRQPVRFSTGINRLYQMEQRIFVEIGPRASLLGMAKNILQATVGEQAATVQWLPSLRRSVSDWQQMLQSLAQLYVLGAPVNWENLTQELSTASTAVVSMATAQPAATVTSPILTLLQQGAAEQLMQEVKQAGFLSEAEQESLPKLMHLLVQRHQQYLAAASLNELLYAVEWRLQPQAPQAPQTMLIPGTWVIFADAKGFGRVLADQLKNLGQNVVMVAAGDNFQQLACDSWQIQPTRPDDVEHVFQEIKKTAQPLLRGVLHLWGLDSQPASDLTLVDLEQTQQRGCGSVLAIIQALARQSDLTTPRVWLVTQDATSVAGTGQGIAQSPLWGLGKVIALEQPQMWGGLIDLAAEGDLNTAAHDVLAEIMGSQNEHQIALRSGQRYVARLTRRPLPMQPGFMLRPDSTYLITGGLGALGLQLAQWFVNQGARHLVLIGRRAPLDEVQQQLRQFEQTGAVVITRQADIACLDNVTRIIEEIQATMPPLRGIVHAAGVLEDGTLLQQNYESFARVMSPKVQGAWNLHTCTRHLPLDFFLLFSSAASLLGSPGQGNYAAANAFLDAFASYRRSLHLPATSINWGPWAGAGMAASLDPQNQLRWKASGITLLTPEQGLQAIALIAGQVESQVGVLNINWEVFQRQVSAGRPMPFLSDFVRPTPSEQPEAKTQPGQAQTILQRLHAAPPEERQMIVSAYLHEQVARVLGLSPTAIDDHQSLNTLGFDSLMAIDLKTRLQSDLQIEIPMVKFVEDPSITSLTTIILELLSAGEKRVSASAASQIKASSEPVVTGQDLTPEQAGALLQTVEQIDENNVDELLKTLLAHTLS